MASIPPSVVVPPTDAYGRIYQTMQNALLTIEAFFNTNGVALPARQLVSAAQFAYDDEFVGITIARQRPGKPGIPSLEPVRPYTFYSLECELHLIRAVPTVDETGHTDDELNAEFSKITLLDWWLLDRCVTEGTGAGEAGDPGDLQGAPFRDVMINEVLPYGPQGGLQGVVSHLVLQQV